MIHNPSNPVWIDYLFLFIHDSLTDNTWLRRGFNKFASDTDFDLVNPQYSLDGQAPGIAHHIGVLATQNMKDAINTKYATLSTANKNKVGIYWESDGWNFDTALADTGLQRIPEETAD